ncbi:hypothetical protein LIER_30820 [Lithospermum erythrorhizon]
MIQATKDMLNSKFDMKDLGQADVILGVRISRTQDGLVLNQSHYVDMILDYSELALSNEVALSLLITFDQMITL